jgi:hypothetical protein
MNNGCGEAGGGGGNVAEGRRGQTLNPAERGHAYHGKGIYESRAAVEGEEGGGAGGTGLDGLFEESGLYSHASTSSYAKPTRPLSASGLVPVISAVSPGNLGISQSLDVSPILCAETTRNEEAMEGDEQGEEEGEGEGDSDRHAPHPMLVHAHRTHIAKVEIPDFGFVRDTQQDSSRLSASAIRMQADAPNNPACVVSSVFSRLAQPKARDGNVRKWVSMCVSLFVCVYISDIYTHACAYTVVHASTHTHVRTPKQQSDL